MDKTLTFPAELNKCFSKLAVAIKSIYCVRHSVPLDNYAFKTTSFVTYNFQFGIFSKSTRVSI